VAVVLAWRAAILIAPGAVRYVQSASGSGAPGPTSLPRYLWNRLNDPSESDEDLSAAVSEQSGSLSNVTTFSEPFSLRKAQVRWGRNSGAAAGTDDAVTTHHFIKLASGSPVASWDAADFLAVEGAFTTFWNALKANYASAYSLKQIRWYTVDPDVALSGPPVRIVDPALPGTNGGFALPPQVALSITERTTDAKAWGRFYMPGLASGGTALQANGRAVTAMITAHADAADAFYETCVTANVPGVVYSSAKPARETAGGTELPAQPARALTVTTVQVDDLFDVIRSRRYNEPLLRVQRAVAGA
jgi:hypothetical protein